MNEILLGLSRLLQLVLVASLVNAQSQTTSSPPISSTPSAAAAVGQLPVCAQTCVTYAFDVCNCELGRFDCFCTCPGLEAVISNCTTSRCTEVGLNATVIESIAVICPNLRPRPSSSSSTTTTTSSTRTSLSSHTTSRTSSSIGSNTCSVTKTLHPTGGGIYYNSTETAGQSSPSYCVVVAEGPRVRADFIVTGAVALLTGTAMIMASWL